MQFEFNWKSKLPKQSNFSFLNDLLLIWTIFQEIQK